MTAAAYWINGQAVPAASFYSVACEPGRSVVVEACAGAGKTWMLVSRILRALLDGTPPDQILAITFTRKAAGEMRERLQQWLQELAHATPEKQRHELLIRGVPSSEISRLQDALQTIYQRWMLGEQGVSLLTIHGWFAQLVKAAPLDVLSSLGLPPELDLLEDQDDVWDELWARFLKRIDADAHLPANEQAHAPSFDVMLHGVGSHNLSEWLKTSLGQRMEIMLAAQAGTLVPSVPNAARWSEAWAAWTSPEEALDQAQIRRRFLALASALGAQKGKTPQDAGASIVSAFEEPELAARARALNKALLTADGRLKHHLSKFEDQIEDLSWAHEWLGQLAEARLQQTAHENHVHMIVLSQVLFEEYAQLKRQRGLSDMSDLEMAAARLLSDPVLSGWIQERLDSRVRLLLMDEFQDTSPLQWHALKAWLSAYAGAGGGRSGQTPISLFLVGDPKQSIYRFRRADPRVFAAARDFVVTTMGGDLLACDHTRRNAPAIIKTLNQVMMPMASQGWMSDFRPHTTESTSEGMVSVLSSNVVDDAENLVGDGRDAGGLALSQAWRPSLTQARTERLAGAREQEADQVAMAVAELLNGLSGRSVVKPGEVFVLARKRSSLLEVARALEARGIPHQAPTDTLLADVPEVQDLLAMLDVLVSPQHDLSLARALKSALFNWSDELLMHLAQCAQRTNSTWWQALMGANLELWPEEVAVTCLSARKLLSQWSILVQTLPPHDLLSRIVHDTDLRARVMARAPANQRSTSLGYIDALLEASLGLDAGRDATPYRFIRALRRARLPVPAKTESDAVQLLTIHGAKGLEADVVVLMDTQPTRARTDHHALAVDWPPDMGHPARVAFMRSASRPAPTLKDLLTAEEHERRREQFNALYVAVTRAKQRLVVSRAPWGKQADTSEHSWWNALVSSGAIDPDHPWTPQPATPAGNDKAGALLDFSDFPALPQDVGARQLPVDDDPEHLKAVGHTVHRAMEWLTTLPTEARSPEVLGRAVAQAARMHELPADELTRAMDQVMGMLAAPALRAWLSPEGPVWAANEVPICVDGQVLRLDRLVAIEQSGRRQWWVIDYKLGHRPQDQAVYLQQLRRYVKAVQLLQPGDDVRAAFITGRGEWVPVSV